MLCAKWKKPDSEATFHLIPLIEHSGKGKSQEQEWDQHCQQLGVREGACYRESTCCCILGGGVGITLLSWWWCMYLPKFVEVDTKKSKFYRMQIKHIKSHSGCYLEVPAHKQGDQLGSSGNCLGKLWRHPGRGDKVLHSLEHRSLHCSPSKRTIYTLWVEWVKFFLVIHRYNEIGWFFNFFCIYLIVLSPGEQHLHCFHQKHWQRAQCDSWSALCSANMINSSVEGGLHSS